MFNFTKIFSNRYPLRFLQPKKHAVALGNSVVAVSVFAFGFATALPVSAAATHNNSNSITSSSNNAASAPPDFSNRGVKFSSVAFLERYAPWAAVLPLGSEPVTLLRDNVSSLMRKHPDCRLLPKRKFDFKEDKGTGRLACHNTSSFEAEGQEVFFTYAEANDVLIGASFEFTNKHRAMQFAERIVSALKSSTKAEPFVVENAESDDTFSHSSTTTYTPMFSVSLQPAQSRGTLVIIRPTLDNLATRIQDSELYARSKLSGIDFGSLVIGKSLLSEVEQLVEEQRIRQEREASAAGEGEQQIERCDDITPQLDRSSNGRKLTREYFGNCFDFPYQAHMQLTFNNRSGLLESAVLTPIGASTTEIVDAWLRKKYDGTTYCKRINSDLEIRPARSAVKSSKVPKKNTKFAGKKASAFEAEVFTGECSNPIIYAVQSPMTRFVFENRLLSDEEILATFESKRAANTGKSVYRTEYDVRADRIRGFFE